MSNGYQGSDYANIGGSTMQGVAAGFPLGPLGMVIGGAIGFVSGIFGAEANTYQRAYEDQMIENAAVAAGLQGEAREIQILLNRLQADRGRREISQRAVVASEGIRAGETISGMVGSSIARNARAGVQQQLASNLQFSFLTQSLGEQISEKVQEAAEAAVVPPEEPETLWSGTTIEGSESAAEWLGNMWDDVQETGLGSVDTGSGAGDALLNAADVLLGPIDDLLDKWF